MNFLDLIKSTGYITVSKELAREIGLHESIILAELISQYEYFKNKKELDNEGYFYCTVDKMEHQTTLGKDAQSKAIKNLEKLNLIKKDSYRGLPARRHFKIIEQNIINLILNEKYQVKKYDNPRNKQVEENPRPRKQKKLDQGSGKSSTIHNNNYNNNKTEEEKARARENISNKIPKKIKAKFQQIYNRKLSAEFYQEITKIYSNTDIILKALSICEKQADKPKYLLIMLQDWQDNELESVTGINTYLENRQANKELRHSKKDTTATRPETPEEELQRLYEKGYR